MKKYLVKRILTMVPTLFGVVTVVFLMIHLIPGDPVEIMLGETAAATDKESLRQELGLNKPVLTQYFSYLANLATGNLGSSIHSHEPVATEIFSRIPATIELAVFGLFFAIFFALPFGVMAAVKRA